MRQILAVVLSFAIAAPAWAQSTAKSSAPMTDAQVKEAIVKASIAGYVGSCPCPFSRDRAGRSCGRRSAYSRPGGAAPLCFVEDVSAKMVDEYRKARGVKAPAVAPAGDRC